MIIENLVQICQGELREIPPITSITNLTTKVEKVTRGTAFFGSSKTDIRQAIQNGAYAIIYEQDFFINDKEIAWIKVDSIFKTLLRLMRYEIEKREVKAVLLSKLQLNMLKVFSFDFDAKILPNSAEEAFTSVYELRESSYLFLADEDIIKVIAPKYESLQKSLTINILQSHNIFRSSFICNKHYFKDFAIAPLFVEDFCEIISFFDENNLAFKVEAMDKIGHFEPRFVNQAFRPRPFGSTGQALIIESDAQLFDKEVLWLNEYVPNSELLLLAPHNEKVTTDCKRYTSPKVIQTLNISGIRYILMLGDKEQILEALETSTPNTPTLF